MQRILRKRIFRDFREHMMRYLALSLMIILGMYIVISLIAAADTIITGSGAAAEAQSVENGQFSLFVPMRSTERQKLLDAGVTLEEHFYLDYETEDGFILRVSAVREEIDRVLADKGRLPEKKGEILLEKRYCEEHNIFAGDKIRIGERSFTVCGIGTSPDYNAPYRNLSDSVVDSSQFGTAFVSKSDYELLREDGNSLQSEEYLYAYLLKNNLTQGEVKELLQDFTLSPEDMDNVYVQKSSGQTDNGKFPKLTHYLPAEDNIRIGAAADDVVINRTTGLFAGVLLMVLFAYVISVFVAHTIEKESEVIGTLYALGIKRRELLLHYLFLPVMVTLAAGVIGMVLGSSSFGVKVQMREAYDYFSIPDLPVMYKPYLLVYGILMPPAVTAFTNLLVIWRKLKKPVLVLFRREQKTTGIKSISIPNIGFVRTFQIRYFLREKRTAATVFLGMFLTLLVCMIGLNCYVLCEHIKTDSVADTRYEYMYTYKYPEETVPKGGEEACGLTLKKEVFGYNLNITLLGIHPDNPYFDAPVKQGKSRVLVSSAMASKYGLRAGDNLVLKEEENDKSYAFTVDGIVPYFAGFSVFMDIDSMRELTGKEEDYYNIVFSDDALEIDSDRLYAISSKTAVEKSASVFVEKMEPMIRMVTAASALLFLVVMYLMLKVMIDRCALSISMMKIFGYRKKEIQKLYLNGNLVIVAVSAVVGIPLSKILIDAVYPYLVSNAAVGLNLAFDWWMYPGLAAVILLLYLISMPLLLRKINRILSAQALKTPPTSVVTC